MFYLLMALSLTFHDDERFVVRADVPRKKNKPRRVFPPRLLLLTHLFAVERAEFSHLTRVADLRDEPRFRSDIGCHLLLNGFADWRRSESDRVTSLCYCDVVL